MSTCDVPNPLLLEIGIIFHRLLDVSRDPVEISTSASNNGNVGAHAFAPSTSTPAHNEGTGQENFLVADGTEVLVNEVVYLVQDGDSLRAESSSSKPLGQDLLKTFFLVWRLPAP
jgi:hypothetical protein